MGKELSHVICYSHPFAAVTSSLWTKYDHHKYVQNIEIIDRHVDEKGLLHSTRLLSMGGNLPAIFAAVVPVKLVHMLETVVVDPYTQTMTVETTNINCQSVLDARSRSRYSPSPGSPDSTKYEIEIAVRAFPRGEHSQAASPSVVRPEEGREEAAVRSPSASEKSGWKVEIVGGHGLGPSLQTGYVASRIESWVVDKLLSNVNKGEKHIDGFCRRWRDRHTMMCESSARRPDSDGWGSASSDSQSPPLSTKKPLLQWGIGSSCVRGCMESWGNLRGGGLTNSDVEAEVAKRLRFSHLLSSKFNLTLFRTSTSHARKDNTQL